MSVRANLTKMLARQRGFLFIIHNVSLIASRLSQQPYTYTHAHTHTPAITATSVHPRTLAMSALIKLALDPADPWQSGESTNKWPQASPSRGSS